MKALDKPLILILVKRAAIFLFILCSVSIFYYAVGSESSFLDETEAMLLDFARISALGSIAAAAMGLLFSIAYAMAGRYRFRAGGATGYILSAAFATLVLLLSQTLSILSRGLH